MTAHDHAAALHAYAARHTAQMDAIRVRPCPSVSVPPGPIRLGVDEHWCARCGETIGETGYCHRCGSRHGRPAFRILKPEEYYIAA